MGYFETLLSQKKEENCLWLFLGQRLYKAGIYLFDLLLYFSVNSYGHV